MKYSENDLQLFNEAGINVEDRNYTKEEVEHFKIKVTEYIMSQSSKDINTLSTKFSKILH
ncbi:MAG: hypothetical protein HFJ49_00240 [Clostridia bacterium]|jgi:hypothetical protein|nr:hypothetical protein [Clostridia bacterium]